MAHLLFQVSLGPQVDELFTVAVFQVQLIATIAAKVLRLRRTLRVLCCGKG